MANFWNSRKKESRSGGRSRWWWQCESFCHSSSHTSFYVRSSTWCNSKVGLLYKYGLGLFYASPINHVFGIMRSEVTVVALALFIPFGKVVTAGYKHAYLLCWPFWLNLLPCRVFKLFIVLTEWNPNTGLWVVEIQLLFLSIIFLPYL